MMYPTEFEITTDHKTRQIMHNVPHTWKHVSELTMHKTYINKLYDKLGDFQFSHSQFSIFERQHSDILGLWRVSQLVNYGTLRKR